MNRRHAYTLAAECSPGRICPQQPYPRTVAACLRDRKRYQPAALRAIRAFRQSRPWQGTFAERCRKISALHRVLIRVYGLGTGLTIVGGRGCDSVTSGFSSYCPAANMITIRGRLSIITYLHEFGHALGKGERGACVWSINLFRRFFPRSFSRLQPIGHALFRVN